VQIFFNQKQNRRMNIYIENLNEGDEKFNRLLAFLDGEDIKWSTQQPALPQAHVMWGQSPELLPRCSKCNMPHGSAFPAQCLAEDCPGTKW
jgi:hypothetical protein